MVDRITAQRGHTIPELLAMLGIAAILAGAAVPVFSNLLLETRMSAALATAMHAVNLARQFSATRSEAIRLCGSSDDRECTGGTDWTAGLLVAGDRSPFRQSLPLRDAARGPRIRSNRAVVSFEGGSGFATPATLTLCDRRGARAARAVIVSRSGRPRASDRDASDRALTC
jgi:type IV fimbrial biogenesis protein FimT